MTLTDPIESIHEFFKGHLADPSYFGVLMLAFSYLAIVVGVRWQMIARPIRNSIATRLQMLAADAKQVEGDENEPLRSAVLKIVDDARQRKKSWNLTEILFWSRGEETGLWQMVDKADAFMAGTWSKQRLSVALLSARARLAELAPNPAALVLSAQIALRLAPRDAAAIDKAHPDLGEPTKDELYELYREAISIERDAQRRNDVESDYFNNKILWHILISLAAIEFVANVGPTVWNTVMHQQYLSLDLNPLASAEKDRWRHTFILFLLAGAVGGILSRLTRVMQPGSNPSEHGLSWMAMFLSPLVGALAGWAGCILLIGAHDLNVLLSNVKEPHFSTLLVGAAVLFGFSERMFADIAEMLQNKAVPKTPTNPT